MAITYETALANKVLACLPAKEFQILLQHLSLIHFSVDDSVYHQEEPLDYIYFPLDCVVSTVVLMDDGASVEIRLTGREGVMDIAALFGEQRARNWSRALIPGDALRIGSEALKERFRQSEIVQQELTGCYRRMIMQFSQRAVCSSRHTIMQRLCCWLLMVHDRVGADDLPLTHDAIAGRLGARRAGITQAANMLRAMRAVSYSRGHIYITDSHAIEQLACECYQHYKEEFEWFVGGREAAQRASAEQVVSHTKAPVHLPVRSSRPKIVSEP